MTDDNILLLLASHPLPGVVRKRAVHFFQDLNDFSFNASCTGKNTVLNHANVLSEIEAWKSMEPRALKTHELDLYNVFAQKKSKSLFCFFEKEDDGSVILVGVAAITFHPRGSSLLFLEGFLVHPLVRGKGVGKRLFNTITQTFLSPRIQSLFKRSPTYIFLLTYPSPEKYWIKLGFVPYTEVDRGTFQAKDTAVFTGLAAFVATRDYVKLLAYRIY